uniref:Tumor suppressor 2, mitochondrial calcium regulator a n=1 Tax=Sinocyclocheilus rhinocerous TaxID=307959 RepID=A0A673FPS6_9TELE
MRPAFIQLLFVCCSSLYFDEDGDLAHEFYEETVVTKNGRKKAKLKRIQKNLIPQVRDTDPGLSFFNLHHSLENL